MNEGDIDWIFDTSREGSIPKGGIWRIVVKWWMLRIVLASLAVIAFAVAPGFCPQGVSPLLFSMIVRGGLILVFCCFLVWMTYRRASRRNRERKERNMRPW